MILDDIKLLGSEYGGPVKAGKPENSDAMKQAILNKYKVELIYYMAIEKVLARYGNDEPEYNKAKRDLEPKDMLGSRNIAALNRSALCCARDQMAARLSDQGVVNYSTLGDNRLAKHKDMIRLRKGLANSSNRIDLDDISVVLSETGGALSEDELKKMIEGALRNSEALWQTIATGLTKTEALRSEKKSDDEMFEETKKALDRLCDFNDYGSAASEILREISGADTANGERVSFYDSVPNIKILNRDAATSEIVAFAQNAKRKASDFELIDDAGIKMADIDKRNISAIMDEDEVWYVKASGTRDKLMLKVSPLMPDARHIFESGHGGLAYDNNLIEIDTERGLAIRMRDSKGRQDYIKMSDSQALASAGSVFLADTEMLHRKELLMSDSFGGSGSAGNIAPSGVLGDDWNRGGDRQAKFNIRKGLNESFKIRMVSILEKYSQRKLNDSDVAIIDRMFTSNDGESTIFSAPDKNGGDMAKELAEIEKNAKAYFDYIEHVCKETKRRMSSHEFEIHLDAAGDGAFRPCVYFTGERLDDKRKARSRSSRYMAFYPYANYNNATVRNEVLPAMGDIEPGGRDGYRICSASVHAVGAGANENGKFSDNRYFQGREIDEDMVANMRNVFDVYMGLDSAGNKNRSDVCVRKVDRTNKTYGRYDAAQYVDAYGRIDYTKIKDDLASVMTDIKNSQLQMFMGEDTAPSLSEIRFASALYSAFKEPVPDGSLNGGVSAGLAESIADMYARDPEGFERELAERLEKALLREIRPLGGQSRNEFVVARHLFAKYVDVYAHSCAAAMRDAAEPDRAGAIANIGIPTFDRSIAEDGLDEIFGYYANNGNGALIIKANMCKYMSGIAPEDFDKMLTLLSYSKNAEYVKDKTLDMHSFESSVSDIKIQLFSAEAYGAQRTYGNDDNESEDAESDIENTIDEDGVDSGASVRYDALFDDEMWYSSTFFDAKPEDYSYAQLIAPYDPDDETSRNIAVFKATHPLQVAALDRIYAHMRANRDYSSDRLKISGQGIAYIESPDPSEGIRFKLGPIIDEKAYIRPYAEYAEDGDEDAVEVGERLLLDDDGNRIYADGMAEGENSKKIRVYNEIRISDDGEVLNPIVFGALDMPSLTGAQGENINRFYGVSAQIADYDGYDHESYIDRLSFNTYQTNVLANISKTMSIYYIANNMPTGEGEDGAKIASQGVIRTEIGANTLSKCYRTNAYILGEKTACTLADAFMDGYLDAMSRLQETAAGAEARLAEAEGIPQELRDRLEAFYHAVAISDLAAMDGFSIAYHDDPAEFGALPEGIKADIEACADDRTSVASLYSMLDPEDRYNAAARAALRHNANNIMSQAAMNRKRVVFPKILLDQNIGLYLNAMNLQHANRHMLIGDIDDKTMRLTDGKSPRVAVFQVNNIFDPVLSATAKQLGAVAFLNDGVDIDYITGRIDIRAEGSRCSLVALGVEDFVTGAVDCRYSRYPGAQAVDRAQLSANAIEKGLNYAGDMNMAMINLGYNMEDAYVMSKKASEKLGHFDRNGRFRPLSLWDKVGDSESGNKGVTSKIVDAHLEIKSDGEALKLFGRELAEGYIRKSIANGREGDIRGYLGENMHLLDDIAEYDALLESDLNALYANALDYLAAANRAGDRDARIGDDLSAAIGSLDIDSMSSGDKARALENIMETHMSGSLKSLLDESLITMSGKRYAVHDYGSGFSGNYDLNDTDFGSCRQRLLDIRNSAADAAYDGIIEALADEENGDPAWRAEYAHEKRLWWLFRDNPDLDVAVTNVCVLTRSNPSLLMYMMDMEAERSDGIDSGNLVIRDPDDDSELDPQAKIDAGYAKAHGIGVVSIYLDSHTSEDKNKSYISNAYKAGRAYGAQEMYMLDAKHAYGFMRWTMLNDNAIANGLERMNAKLMMNGYMIDAEDGYSLRHVSDIISEAGALEPIGDGGVMLSSQTMHSGHFFVDMDALAAPLAERLLASDPTPSKLARIAEDIGDGDFTSLADMLSGNFGGKEGDGSYTPDSMSVDAKIKAMFSDTFGASGGNFMILPRSMPVFDPKAYHKSIKDKKASAQENSGLSDIPMGLDDSYSSWDPDLWGYDDSSAFDFGADASAMQYNKDISGMESVSLAGSVDVGLDGDGNPVKRSAVPLFVSSVETVNENTETVTARLDDRLQMDIFKAALGRALLDRILEAEDPDGNSLLKDDLSNKSRARSNAQRAANDLENRIGKAYNSIYDPDNSSLSMANNMAHFMKKNLYRVTFGRSLTCVWAGNPVLAIDEAGISFEKAKELGYLREKASFKELPDEAKALIPDDFEHMDQRYEPIGPDDYIWINRSPGQTTGCVRMLRPAIICQSGDGLMINPALATIFDGDFDGDTVGVSNPMAASEDVLRIVRRYDREILAEAKLEIAAELDDFYSSNAERIDRLREEYAKAKAEGKTHGEYWREQTEINDPDWEAMLAMPEGREKSAERARMIEIQRENKMMRLLISDGNKDAYIRAEAKRRMDIGKAKGVEKYINPYEEAVDRMRDGALKDIESKMSMSANMVHTAEYDTIRGVDVHPLFIAANADFAAALDLMSGKCKDEVESRYGIGVKDRMDEIALKANILEELKQICYDGRSGTGEQAVRPEYIDPIRASRMERIAECGKALGYPYADGLIDTAKAYMNGDESVRDRLLEAVHNMENANFADIKAVYRDMTYYMSREPSYTYGTDAVAMICNKIGDANRCKKGKKPQLDALISFAGMTKGDNTEGFALDIDDSDKKFKLRACWNDGKGGRTPLFTIASDNGVLKAEYPEGEIGDAMRKAVEEKFGNAESALDALRKDVKFDFRNAISDVPQNLYRTQTESNIAAQADKSDATGKGGAVAQKLQMLLAQYGYAELALRISGPITQKFLDAKQNVNKCEKNLKIGNAVLGAACRFQYVEELQPGYIEKAIHIDKDKDPEGYAKKREAVMSQIYNGSFRVEPERQITAEQGVEQLSNLLEAMGQPALRPLDKKIILACVNTLQEDYMAVEGIEPNPDPDVAKYLVAPLKDMIEKTGCVPYQLMYGCNDGEHAARIEQRIKAVENGGKAEQASIFGNSAMGKAATHVEGTDDDIIRGKKPRERDLKNGDKAYLRLMPATPVMRDIPSDDDDDDLKRDSGSVSKDTQKARGSVMPKDDKYASHGVDVASAEEEFDDI